MSVRREHELRALHPFPEITPLTPPVVSGSAQVCMRRHLQGDTAVPVLPISTFAFPRRTHYRVRKISVLRNTHRPAGVPLLDEAGITLPTLAVREIRQVSVRRQLDACAALRDALVSSVALPIIAEGVEVRVLRHTERFARLPSLSKPIVTCPDTSKLHGLRILWRLRRAWKRARRRVRPESQQCNDREKPQDALQSSDYANPFLKLAFTVLRHFNGQPNASLEEAVQRELCGRASPTSDVSRSFATVQAASATSTQPMITQLRIAVA